MKGFLGDKLGHGTVQYTAISLVAVLGMLTILGIAIPNVNPQASMRISPDEKVIGVHNEFTVEVIIDTTVPVNVFAGELRFSKDLLHVKSIDYNTSIADLWAELPWYSNGEGTLNFGGGSTKQGGFMGTGSLITVTFETLGEGQGMISIFEPRILLHDGLGTDATVEIPIDAIFTIENPAENLVAESVNGTRYEVVQALPTTDLNGDGKQSIADISIFMLNLKTNEPRFDLNMDSKVDLKDLNILLGAK